MKRFFFFAAALLAALSFTACSDDDETNLPITPDNIVGTWQIVHQEGWEIYDGEKETWSEDYSNEDGWYWTISFDTNNSYVETEYDNGKVYDMNNGTYSISGNTITLNDSYEPTTQEIKKLTESELIWTHKYADEEYSVEDTETFKRIK